jgi:hypothetical protein
MTTANRRDVFMSGSSFTLFAIRVQSSAFPFWDACYSPARVEQEPVFIVAKVTVDLAR